MATITSTTQTFPGDAIARPKFPPQIKYIIGNEAAERFSFYGMRSILTVFMVQYLLIEKSEATAYFHLFVSAAYFLPLIGAYISDKLLGKYKTILYLSLVYCLGHATLAVWESKEGLLAGLTLIAIGAGGIKPCVSAHVGDQFDNSNNSLLPSIYGIFYWSVNFGSFTSTLLIPKLLSLYGPSVAFGIPGILMALATFIFWLGRKQYVHVPPTRISKTPSFVKMVATTVGARFQKSNETPNRESFFATMARIFGPVNAEGVRAVFKVMSVFFFIIIFWALFDQHSSSWVLQAKRMNLSVAGLQLEASQIAALNPLMVMILIPLLNIFVYPASDKLGFKLTPLRKMVLGMAITAFSFVCIAFIEKALDQGQVVSVLWQVPAYLLITTGEVMVSVTGLEFAYTQSPKAMKSTVMSIWLLTTFFGNMFTAVISKLNSFEGESFFWFFAAVMFVFTGLFALFSIFYKPVELSKEA